mmetsp:Transcript_28611/g.44820  ORF Transcript_28611/g.44820 Transcript_28611/m.44820 type:complete len:212 (-) Transcript_28611:238-873(-)
MDMKPVTVLAAVEVKNNPNDIGPVYEKYMERLGWMMGVQDLYDPTEMATKHYRAGNFDRPFWHKDAKTGETFQFDKSSFRLFLPAQDSSKDEEDFKSSIMKRLYFVTKDQVLIGMGPALYRAVQHQAATNSAADISFDDAQFLDPVKAANAIWSYGQSLDAVAESVTQDILMRYRDLPEEFRNICVISRSRSNSPVPAAEEVDQHDTEESA